MDKPIKEKQPKSGEFIISIDTGSSDHSAWVFYCPTCEQIVDSGTGEMPEVFQKSAVIEELKEQVVLAAVYYFAGIKTVDGIECHSFTDFVELKTIVDKFRAETGI